MINPAKIMKMKKAWDTFVKNHPKFPMFLNAAQRKRITEGTIIEIIIKGTDGEEISTNIKVNASDVELFKEITALSR